MAKEQLLLDVSVFSPVMAKKEPFKGKAVAVSSENKIGKFDILPRHINFITLIFNKLVIHTRKGKKVGYKFEKGVVVVKEDKVNIFLGI